MLNNENKIPLISCDPPQPVKGYSANDSNADTNGYVLLMNGNVYCGSWL